MFVVRVSASFNPASAGVVPSALHGRAGDGDLQDARHFGGLDRGGALLARVQTGDAAPHRLHRRQVRGGGGLSQFTFCLLLAKQMSS